MPDDTSDFIHKEFPKKFAKDDFWSQIKRTVNGKPVSEDDIDMIIKQITDHLDLSADNHLLDIGCGNAALASRLFPIISEYTGVDFSSYLLEIANEYFKPHSKINYIEYDALNFVRNYEAPDSINKALVYGCMSYLNRQDFRLFLETISTRFINIDSIFIGNIPDISKSEDFYKKRDIDQFDTENEQSPIGVWWDTEEISRLAQETGFLPEILRMPETFYGHHYRFDLLLKRT